MKLTILETGQAPEPIRADFPDYPAMFRALFDAAGSDLEYETVSVVRGETLPDPAALDAILITGSPAGVYDADPWIAPLLDFIRWAAEAQTPQIGVCFGHQAIAKALGGRVVKSEKGWGVGRHVYTVDPPEARCLPGTPEIFAAAVSHQDQVVAPPAGAHIVAGSDFTPFGALRYTTAPVISFQGHPEFTDDFAAALYDLRRARIGETAADRAIASLENAETNNAVALWFTDFLKTFS